MPATSAHWAVDGGQNPAPARDPAGAPAYWTLAKKFGAGLMDILGYASEYTPELAKHVQRMFEAIRPGQPRWSAILMRYVSAEQTGFLTEEAT